MKILERLAARPPAPKPASVPPPARTTFYGLPPVGWSQDLARVVALPRRDLGAAYTATDIANLEGYLRRSAPCRCAEFGRPCPTNFRKVQAQALIEASVANGLIAPIGVGHGKTLVDLLLPMVMPECKVAVLLIPANLRAQLLERDVPYYGAHWQLPNIAGGHWFVSGRPVLHVVTYNKLSLPESTDYLKGINPDLIICDEAQNLKDPKSARTIRFARHFRENPATRLCILSGTIASKSIKDYAHLAALALGDASPLPLHQPTVEEWASALDPNENIAAPGLLGARLCVPGEHVRDGFRRRRNDTNGVVSTDESSLATRLVISKRDPGPVPPEILAHIEEAHRGIRPDGEEFVEQLQMNACARQLGSGFFHRWKFPRMEPEKLIRDWFLKRQDFNRELREKLKRPREHLDSPGLLVKAAIRAYQTPPYDGDKPTWPAESWPSWRDVHDKVHYVSEAVWLSDYVVKDAAAWARENVGIVWVEFPELGERIAKAAGVPYYGGGPEASATIGNEKGDRSIVASIKAHGTGKNLQAFSRNLVVNPPSDGAAWEQMIARTHRPGQMAPVVTVDVYQHTDDYRDAFATARDRATFIEQTDGQPQKLLMAEYHW